MQHKYVPQIDALRALAVISVILYHLSPNILPGGFSGVDIFFVISGYVVSASLKDIETLPFSSFISIFYARRLRRIIPALIVCLVVIALASALFIPKSWLGGSTTYTILMAFIGLSNFTLIYSGDGYFSPRTEFNPATHTWSLGVEEQFYLLLPVIYYFTLRSRYKFRLRLVLVSLMPAIAVGSFFYCASMSAFNSPEAYYSIISRFWELGLGVILFSLHNADQRIPFLGSRPTAVVSVGFFLTFFSLLFADKGHFPYPWAIASTLGTVCLIEGSTGKFSLTNPLLKALGRWPGPAIGRRSYSLYLWHWPIFVLFRWTCGIDSIPMQALAVATTILVAELSFRYVESTTRSNATLISLAPFQQVCALLFFGATAAGMGGLILLFQPNLSLSVTSNVREWTSDASDIVKKATTEGCDLNRVEAPIASGLSISYTHVGCRRDTNTPRLFIVGDSHATALNRFAALYAYKHRTDVIIYTRLGCSFFNLYERTKPECRDFVEGVTTTIIASAHPGDDLLLSSLRLRRFSDQWTRFDSADVVRKSFDSLSNVARQQAATEASAWLQRIGKKELRVVFLAPPPIFGAPAFRCSDWFNISNPICDGLLTSKRDFQIHYRAPVIFSINQLQFTHQNVSIFDPFDKFCPSKECSTKNNGKSMFFDGDHLSGYGNEVIFEAFEEHLSKTSIQKTIESQ